MPHTQSSHVRDCFDLDDNNKTQNAPRKRKMAKNSALLIKVGMWNACSNLKRHLERIHAEKSKRIKQADEQDLKSKQKKLKRESNMTSIASYFRPQPLTVTMIKNNFIWRIIQLVMSGVALRFFESPGFQTLNGEMAQKLGVSVSRESIR